MMDYISWHWPWFLGAALGVIAVGGFWFYEAKKNRTPAPPPEDKNDR